MTPLQLTRLIADAALSRKARGLVRLDLRGKTTVADYFVVCEGDTDRQVRAIADAVMEAVKQRGMPLIRRSGYSEGSWLCLDYGEVVAHIFLPGERAYYDLDGLWGPPRKIRPRPTPELSSA